MASWGSKRAKSASATSPRLSVNLKWPGGHRLARYSHVGSSRKYSAGFHSLKGLSLTAGGNADRVRL